MATIDPGVTGRRRRGKTRRSRQAKARDPPIPTEKPLTISVPEAGAKYLGLARNRLIRGCSTWRHPNNPGREAPACAGAGDGAVARSGSEQVGGGRIAVSYVTIFQPATVAKPG
jgi:hypothetical protein